MRWTQWLSTYIRYSTLARLFLVTMAIMVTAGITIHFVEPRTYPTVSDGVWWAFITSATIGYGDFIPKSNFGRLATIILVLIGGGMMTAYMTSISSSAAMKQKELKEGTLPYKKSNHFLVLGWNSRARYMILKLRETEPDTDIVLIDHTANHHPLPDANIHFINGDPTRDDVLQKANVSGVSTVLITADFNVSENEADMKSIIALLAIKGLNPTAQCIVEILTAEQKDNCKRAGASEIIETALWTGSAMLKCIKD